MVRALFYRPDKTRPNSSSRQNALLQAAVRNALLSDRAALSRFPGPAVYSLPPQISAADRLPEAAGFKKYIQDNIVLNVGDQAGIDVAMEVEAANAAAHRPEPLHVRNPRVRSQFSDIPTAAYQMKP